MESKQVEILLEKYFEGKTTLQEERELKYYFSSGEVMPIFEPYKKIFCGFAEQKKVKFIKNQSFKPKNRSKKWIGLAASFTLLLGVAWFYFNQNKKENLGTFSSPEEVYLETQKALQMVSNELNKGKESVAYLQEYEQTKKTIFK